MARNRRRNRARNKGNGERMAKRPMMPEQDPIGMGMAAPAIESEEDAGEPEANVAPEEQALYDDVLEKYFTGMYVKGKKPPVEGEPSLLDQVHSFFREGQNEGSPVSFVDVLGNTTSQVVMTLEDKMEDEGKPVSGDVLMHSGMRILSDLAEFSEAAGYHDYTEDEMTGAASVAFSVYGAERKAQGRLNEDAIKSEYEMMAEADRQGNLDQILPGASEAAKRMPPPPPAEEMQEAAQPGVAAAQQPLPRRM